MNPEEAHEQLMEKRTEILRSVSAIDYRLVEQLSDVDYLLGWPPPKSAVQSLDYREEATMAAQMKDPTLEWAMARARHEVLTGRSKQWRNQVIKILWAEVLRLQEPKGGPKS